MLFTFNCSSSFEELKLRQTPGGLNTPIAICLDFKIPNKSRRWGTRWRQRAVNRGSRINFHDVQTVNIKRVYGRRDDRENLKATGEM